MRLWIQSATPLEEDPEFRTYEERLKRHIEEVARPETVIDVHGLEGVPPEFRGGIPGKYYLSRHIDTFWFVKNAVRAQREGYDAFVVVCLNEPAFHEIREVLDIPAVFILETSFHLACLLAPKFAILAFTEAAFLRATQLVKEHGLAERMTPGEHLTLTSRDFNAMYANPQRYLDEIMEKGKTMIQRGANILLVMGNPLNLFLLDHGVREIDGVPILDACGTVVKFAELMVDLKNIGITRSKTGLDAAPSRDELVTLLRFYESKEW